MTILTQSTVSADRHSWIHCMGCPHCCRQDRRWSWLKVKRGRETNETGVMEWGNAQPTKCERAKVFFMWNLKNCRLECRVSPDSQPPRRTRMPVFILYILYFHIHTVDHTQGCQVGLSYFKFYSGLNLKTSTQDLCFIGLNHNFRMEFQIPCSYSSRRL